MRNDEVLLLDVCNAMAHRESVGSRVAPALGSHKYMAVIVDLFVPVFVCKHLRCAWAYACT